MITRCKVYQNGAAVIMEKLPVSGMYSLSARAPSGAMLDKIRCDDYRMAREYWRAFCQLARKAC